MSNVAMFCCQKPMHECIHAEEGKRTRWYCEVCHWEVEAVEPDIDISGRVQQKPESDKNEQRGIA